jgi:hypothetical protein
LKEYEKKTKKDLLAHPLAAQLQSDASFTNYVAWYPGTRLELFVNVRELSMRTLSKIARVLAPPMAKRGWMVIWFACWW